MPADTKIPVERKQRIVDTLTRLRAVKPCPRCDRRDFSIIDGYASLPIHNDVRLLGALGVPNIPLVLVVCTNCGFIAPHALGLVAPDELDRRPEDSTE